jgi:CubicO group peptidase (beta-lactamase class C family)
LPPHAQAVKQGELRLDDPVADYVTELAQGADIRSVTLAELASHTSGLPRAPQNYEPWHKGKYTLQDFIRFLQSWKADKDRQPGKQYLYPMRHSYCCGLHWNIVSTSRLRR